MDIPLEKKREGPTYKDVLSIARIEYTKKVSSKAGRNERQEKTKMWPDKNAHVVREKRG